MNFEHRPLTYNSETIGTLLASIKGEARRQTVTNLIKTGDVHALEDWLIKARLSPKERETWSRIHPKLMGGEYLPDGAAGEVEIARICLESTTADVISVRARSHHEQYRYSIVDEYNTTFTVYPAQTKQPLTLGELIDMVDFAEGDGTESFVDALRRNADSDGDDPDAARSFVDVRSEFYPDLERYYTEEVETWLAHRAEEPAIKYGLHKLAAGLSLSRALNIFEFACNKPDSLSITKSSFRSRVEKLRRWLSDPITAQQVQALRDVVMKRQRFDDLIKG